MKFSSSVLIVSTLVVITVNAKVADFSQFYDTAGQIRDNVFDSWSKSQIKEWADAHGIKVPQQPAKKGDLSEFSKKHSHTLHNDIGKYSKYLDQARKKFTTYVQSVGSDMYDKSGKLKDNVFESWPATQLKSFTDMHGLQIPEKGDKASLQSFGKQYKALLQHDLEQIGLKNGAIQENSEKDTAATSDGYLAKMAQAKDKIAQRGSQIWQGSGSKPKSSGMVEGQGMMMAGGDHQQKLLNFVKGNKQPNQLNSGSGMPSSSDELTDAGSGLFDKAKHKVVESGGEAYEKAADAISNGFTKFLEVI